MLYLVDASIFIYDAWQRSLPSYDLDERPNGAIVGFTRFLVALIHARRPERLACAFDGAGRHGIRNDLLPEYKSDRPPVPAALQFQLAECRHVARALDIAGYSSGRVEADDLIGMLARDGRREGEPVAIVTGDKDLAQFVRPGDRLYDPRHGRWLGHKSIQRRFGVKPAQIADWLALAGDASDNIPGVPGVGAATAARLLRYWGSLDLLLASPERVATMRFRGAPQVAVALERHRERIWRVRRLTGLIEDPEQRIDPTALDWSPPDPDTVAERLRARRWREADIASVVAACSGRC